MKIVSILPMAWLLASLCSCSSSTNAPQPSPASGTNCLGDAIKATSTKIDDSPSVNKLLLSFDVKNEGAVDYDISKGSKVIYFSFAVTTTDGTVYDSEGPLTVTSLKAGATGTSEGLADYGSGKTYKSLSFKLICK
jgi:hypothetical protein